MEVEFTVSGLVFISNGVKFGYPFVEAISSYLPVVDEIVVVYDIKTEDDTLDVLKDNFDNLRIVRCPFLIDEIGRRAYGVVRTFGYQACFGDLVLLFDADGVLHERDLDRTKEFLCHMVDKDITLGYWEKQRFYTPSMYYQQHKHKGILNKRVLGDALDFYGGGGADSVNVRGKEMGKHVNSGINIFGYEHIWDSQEALRKKTVRYGRMLDRQKHKKMKPDSEYFKDYVKRVRADSKSWNHGFKLEDHPKVMHDRLKSVTPDHFGYNFFKGEI